MRLTEALLVMAILVGVRPVSALDASKELGRYGRQTWRTENGLPQNTVHAIAQTRDGYIWLGTEGGLARFDGLKFAVFDAENTPDLKNGRIRSLFEDRKGRLWIGTANGLTIFDGSKFHTMTAADGLLSNNIWSVSEDHGGTVWALTAEGLFTYSEDRFRPYNIKSPRPLSINCMTQSKSGFWIGTQEGAKLLGRNGSPVDDASGSWAAGNITALLADREGGLWAGSANGLSVLRDNHKIDRYTVHEGLPGNRISALYQDHSGVLWVSTEAGLARIAQGKVESFPSGDPLNSCVMLTMFEDREGSLWMGSDADGVTVLRDTRFTTLTSKEGLSDDLVRCVFEDKHGHLWVGTDKGLNRLAGGMTTTLTTKDGLSSDVILSLAEDADGRLLVGTPDGLNVLEDGRVRVITSADGLADDFVRSIYRDHDGSLWIGTRHGLSHSTAAGFKTYTQANGLGSDLAGAVLKSSDDSVWVGTFNGLSRISGGNLQTFTTKDGLSSNVITSLAEDADQALWIGTQGGGLNRFRAGKIFRYPSKLGLPDVIYGILQDGKQNLWMSANTGVYRVNRNELNQYAEGNANSILIASYGVADGLRVNECSGEGHPSLLRSRDGALWFATLKGLATIHPQQSDVPHPPPPVTIESFLVDDKALLPTEAGEISPGHSRFAFEYAGLSFIAPYNLKFRYRLEGFDKDWIFAGARRIAYYTNLGPGRYKFRVMARSNDGGWNETGAWLAFRLRPHFYQTLWFYGMMFLAALLLSYALYRWRVRQVESRFKLVLAERNRIAREIHDTLAQGFVAISLQLELIGRTLGASPKTAQDLLKDAQILAQESLSEARRSIWELRSQGENQEDLPSRLSQIATHVSNTTSIKARFQVSGTYRPLPGKVEYELVKIGQEAVANVVRHANANHLVIDLIFEPKKLRLAIADDGCGFIGEPVPSAIHGHFGLKGMRERADRIDAKLTVKSEPSAGTQVSVEAELL